MHYAILFSSYVSHLTMCTLCVCAPLTWSMKLMEEWLTVSCVIPIAFILLYAHHSSDIRVVPGLMCCIIIGKSVAADLSSATSTMNALLVPLSISPNTECPSQYCPRWYFLLPNLYCSWTTNLYWMVDEVLDG